MALHLEDMSCVLDRMVLFMCCRGSHVPCVDARFLFSHVLDKIRRIEACQQLLLYIEIPVNCCSRFLARFNAFLLTHYRRHWTINKFGPFA